jgi:ATP-dependent RNA helicase DeaD
MLVQSHRAKMPQPEELIANTPEARREAQQDRHRPGFENTVWFRMDIGRRHNADPRWLLPLICRRGHITRNEIGAIRIGGDETFFQVPTNIADKFEDASKRTAASEDQERPVQIDRSEGGPREQARQNSKPGGRKPYNKGGRRDNRPNSGGHSGPRKDHRSGPRSEGGPRTDGDGGQVRPGKWDREKGGNAKSGKPKGGKPYAGKPGGLKSGGPKSGKPYAGKPGGKKPGKPGGAPRGKFKPRSD